MYFFIADEHYGHKNIIEYEDRPFKSVEEMNKVLIENNNKVVTDDDIVIHAGDFSFYNKEKTYSDIISKLKGNHIFLEGSHDRWLKSNQLWQKRIGEYYIVVCHYAMRTWPRSHYGSIQLYGHSHGHLPPEGKQMDVGVDTNNFYPYSFDKIIKIMKQGQNFCGGNSKIDIEKAIIEIKKLSPTQRHVFFENLEVPELQVKKHLYQNMSNLDASRTVVCKDSFNNRMYLMELIESKEQ